VVPVTNSAAIGATKNFNKVKLKSEKLLHSALNFKFVGANPENCGGNPAHCAVKL
jgi:hypothetical protein